MNRLTTAIIIVILLSASAALAQQQEHWQFGDLISDGKEFYKVYATSKNPVTGDYTHLLQPTTKEGQPFAADLVLRPDVSPGTKGIEVISGPSAQPPEPKTPAAPTETAEEEKSRVQIAYELMEGAEEAPEAAEAEPKVYLPDISTVTVDYDADNNKYNYFRTTPEGKIFEISQFEVDTLKENEPRITYYKEYAAKQEALGLSVPKTPEEIPVPFDASMVEAEYNPETKKYTYYARMGEEAFDLTKEEVDALRKSNPDQIEMAEYVAKVSAPEPMEPEEEEKVALDTLTDATKETTAQADARAKEPEGPQLTTYPGLAGQYYEVAEMEHARDTAIYIAYDGDGNLHYIEIPASGKAHEISTGEMQEKTGLNAENFQTAYGQRIKDKYAELPSLQKTMGSAVWLYRQYSGMAGWSSLIFDEKFLKKWKDGINKLMCEYTGGLLGKECLTSKICGKYSDIEAPRDGILYASPVGGVPEAVAHIEGQRSLPFVTPSETMWVYTVTFGLSNPSDEEGMTYNIAFNGPARSAKWWPEPQYLPEKGSVSATGAAALMKLSPNDYSEVCIEFDPSIDTFEGKRKGSICNGIAQYSGGATAPYGMTANTTLPAPGSQAGDAPGANV